MFRPDLDPDQSENVMVNKLYGFLEYYALTCKAYTFFHFKVYVENNKSLKEIKWSVLPHTQAW